eukprot:scaffold1596_cov302-Pinguiococcus_pyrenoidosus.AAC.9
MQEVLNVALRREIPHDRRRGEQLQGKDAVDLRDELRAPGPLAEVRHEIRSLLLHWSIGHIGRHLRRAT